MNAEIPVKEGYLPFRAYKTWYRIVGDHDEEGKLPLVCLHGGPGFTHDYLQPLEALAADGRRVVLYDQLGCGNSDHPHDPDLWTVDLYVDEVGAVRRALGLERVHLLGHSWGGMLALEYALTQPAGLASLVVASGYASVPLWVSELSRLLGELPPDVYHTIQKHEAAGTTDSAEYQAACRVFYDRHMRPTLAEVPEWLAKGWAKDMNLEVNHALFGPEEFTVKGRLKDWDITARLGEIRVPALILSGRRDLVTPATVEPVQRGIPGSEWVIFEKSSHDPHIEETERFLAVLGDFLSRAESRR